jgi:hypothetical protein
MRVTFRRLGLGVTTLALPLLLVTCKGTEPAPVATTVVITPPSASLAAIGATQQFSAVVKDQNGNTMSGATVTWATSSGAVVSVDAASGLATAVGNGTAQLTATSGSAAGSADVTVAQVATQLARVSGDNQTGLVSQALGQPLVVQANDANANPVAGVSVAFTGSGSFGTAAVTTTASGRAQTTWTLGQSAGTQTATASATASGGGAVGSPVTFTATAVTQGTPTNVAAYVGNNRPGLVGYSVNVPPAVRVTDIQNSPVSGVGVTFAVTAGGGTITGGTTVTNTDGIAQVGSWSLGATPGVNRATATVTGSGISGNPVAFADTGLAQNYHITLSNYGPTLEPAVQSALDSAVAKWKRIIYRPVGTSNVNYPAGTCGPGTPAINATVTDLMILVNFDSIDGPGKILGQAGPCLIRNISGLTIVGVMTFDTADVASMITDNILNSVMLHEMGHVIGFGSLWNIGPISCLQDTSSAGDIQDTYFSCAGARAEFDSIGGTSYTGAGQTVGGNKVPVENCGNSPYVAPTCGASTVNGHWRETVFGNELMTGFLNSGANPLSVVSIAAQGDLGYAVNYAGADAYSRTFTAPAAETGPAIPMGDDIYHGPIYVIDRAGKVVGVIRR